MSDRDEIERLNAEVDRLREERGPISNAEYAARVCELRERCAALRARLAAAEGLLREVRPFVERRLYYGEGVAMAEEDRREHAMLARIDAPLAVEPDLGEPSPPLTCPSCGWEFGAMEPEPTEPEPVCETCGGSGRVLRHSWVTVEGDGREYGPCPYC